MPASRKSNLICHLVLAVNNMASPNHHREHERPWRGRFVDRNLHDDWLMRLNSLAAFDLFSICEGHVGDRRRPDGAPHVNLRLHGEYMAILVLRWSSFHDQLDQAAVECFNRDSTHWEFELRMGTRLSRLGPRRRKDFVVRLRSTTARTTGEPEPSLAAWFGEIVPAVEMFAQTFA